MFYVQAEDGIRDLVRSRGLGDVYKRQENAYADLYFANPSEIYEDMPLIAEKLNISDEDIELSLIHI